MYGFKIAIYMDMAIPQKNPVWSTSARSAILADKKLSFNDATDPVMRLMLQKNVNIRCTARDLLWLARVHLEKVN